MTDEPKKPTMQDKLVAQIQSFNQQKEQARDTFNAVINQCDGGIKACLWMLQQLDAEAKELAAANLTAEREEALRKEQDQAAADKSKADHAAGLTRPAPDVDPVILEDAAEIAKNIFDAGKAALQVAQDEQIEARGGFVAVPDHQAEACGHRHRLGGPECTVCNPRMVHAGDLEPPTGGA